MVLSYRKTKASPWTEVRSVQTNTIINVLGAIVTVALVTTIVSNANSANVIRSLGDAFSGSIRASMGK